MSKVIWALFDDAEMCYYHSIKEYFGDRYIVYSIGINHIQLANEFGSKNFFYKRIDLSLTNSNLFLELNELPKPDIILASPPCESWSTADCSGRMFVGFDDGKWLVNNKKYYDEYNESCHSVKKRFFIQKETSRIIGENTLAALLLILEKYNPKVWVIENPKTSLMWEFQKQHWNFLGNMNIAYYSTYDSNFSLKPTIFKSNLKLELDRPIGKSNKNHMNSNYGKRSSIPKQLIKELICQIEKKY